MKNFEFIDIEFLVTRKCNQQCYYCNHFKNSIIDYIDMAFIEKIINTYQRHKDIKIVEISGGEPCLCSNIDELLQYLYDISTVKKIILESNGLFRKYKPELLEKFKSKMIVIEHPALNIIDNKINYFYNDITYTNNIFDNVEQILVMDKITTKSLIDNISFFNRLLFNKIISRKIYNKFRLKILTPKNDFIDDNLLNMYNKLYGCIANKELFSDIKYLHRYNNIDTKRRDECAKNSYIQFIDLEYKKICQCSVNVEDCEKFDITEENIYKAINGNLFTKNNICNHCIKYY